jgi:Flp pilus assembly protein TadG
MNAWKRFREARDHHGEPHSLQNWFRDSRGSQLMEFALVLPLLLVLLVGIIDFAQVFNLKQKLNNATREGARFAAGQNSGAGDLSDTSCGGGPCSIYAVRDVVAHYLTSARITDCALGTSLTSSGFRTWTINSSTAGCSGFSLTIERAYSFSNGTQMVVASRVTLSYPYSWSLGNVIGLLLPSSSLALPTVISTNTVMQNLN